MRKRFIINHKIKLINYLLNMTYSTLMERVVGGNVCTASLHAQKIFLQDLNETFYCFFGS